MSSNAALLSLTGVDEALRRGAGARRRRLRGPRRRGRRPRRRQRRRQVDAGQDDRRHPLARRGRVHRSTASRCRSSTPQRRHRPRASRPSTRTSRCATTSTSSPTSSSAARRSSTGRAATRQLDETEMEHRSHELLENLAVTIPSVRSEVGAMSGGQRQQVAVARSLLGEPKLVHARRADRRARRAPDRAGARADQAPARARARRGRDQPQPGRRVRGLRPHRSCCGSGRQAGDYKVGETDEQEIVAAITGAGGSDGNGTEEQA